jgi:hypothetical protein
MPLTDRQRAANRRTGLVLLSIALVFFVGVILARMYGTSAVSIGVLGLVVLLFLVLAVGRHLRK